jgi:hypothetical protein
MAYPGIKEAKRTSLICDHFARVSEANVDLAVQRRKPCDYNEVERILKLILRDEGLSDSPPPLGQAPLGSSAGQAVTQTNQAARQAGRQTQAGGQRQQGQNGRGGGASGGRQKKPPAVAPNGRLICFNYNKPTGCSNPPHAGGGCKNPSTQVDFAHVCLWFYPSSRTYCMQGHSKCDPGVH